MSKKSKILLLTLAPLATAIMPAVTISCDWFKSPYPLKPTPIDPNKPQALINHLKIMAKLHKKIQPLILQKNLFMNVHNF